MSNCTLNSYETQNSSQDFHFLFLVISSYTHLIEVNAPELPYLRINNLDAPEEHFVIFYRKVTMEFHSTNLRTDSH